jgi:hypothetical protein
MGKNRRAARQEKHMPTPRKWGQRDLAILAAALAVGAVIGIGWWIANHRRPVTPSNEAESRDGELDSSRRPNRDDEESDGPASEAQELAAIVGKWVRADGGYVLDIQSVDDDGIMDAAYFNPQPIHVAKAEAAREGGEIKVFVELRDVNYPGSTYDLVYEHRSDRLVGVYFQAVQRQQFEVVFDRMSDP